MIKKKKTARIFSVVITWIFLCASIFIPFLNLTGEKVFAESVDNSLYAFVSKQNKTAEGKIYVDFGIALDYILDDASPAGEVNRSDAEKMTKMRVAPFEYATIHLRTRNLSAIAEEGDYEPINQTVTVYGYNPYASIAVNINRDGLHVHRKELSYEDTLRSFYLEIYKVEIVGLKDGYELLSPNTTPNISAEKLTTEADMSIGSYQESVGDGYNLGLLYNVSHNGRIYYKTAVNEITENDSFYDIVFDLANFNNNWFNTIQYMSERNILKMGINIEGTGYEEENSLYVDNSLMGIQIFAGDSKKVGAPALEGVPDKNIFSDSTVSELARWYIKFQSDYEEDISLTNAYNGTFEGVTVNTSFNDGILLYGDLSNYNWGQGGRYDAFVEQGNSNIFIIDDLDATLNGSSVISTRIWSYLSNKKTKTCAPKVFFMPVNYRAEVVSATVGQAYYDEQGNVKMGVSLRFNEPMQLKQYSSGEELKPSIKGYLNKIVTNEVVFDYVAGDGTDTFYFETDLTELGYNMQLTSVTLNNANGFGEIYDFAPISYNVINGWQTLNLMIDENKVSGWDNVSGVNLPCSYDLRTPEIEMNGSVAQAVKTSHTTTIRTDYISETGTLYYGWAMDDQNIPQNLSSSPILAQGFQTISSPSGISGTRYLYAVAVSELGKQSEPMWIGPFHFDNEAPSLSIDCIKDTYKEKQFTINLSNNSIEGFNKFASLKESIRVVVSSDANGNNPIKELSIPLTEENQKAETVTIQNFTLTAEMLGLQEGYGTYYVTVCDFFSGSATTGEAIMRLNCKGKNIKYILIQLPENLDSKVSMATGDDKISTQKLIDFLDLCERSHYLDQLGIERLIRAATKIKEEHPDTNADLGFRHYTLVEPSTDTLDKLEKFTPDDNGMFASDMLNEFGLSTVLSTWLVRDGYGLTATPEKLVFADYEAYYIGKHLYLITQDLNKEAIDAILVKYETDGTFNPESIVLFGYSFTWTEMETLKTNLKRLKDIKNLHVNFDVRY